MVNECHVIAVHFSLLLRTVWQTSSLSESVAPAMAQTDGVVYTLLFQKMLPFNPLSVMRNLQKIMP